MKGQDAGVRGRAVGGQWQCNRSWGGGSLGVWAMGRARVRTGAGQGRAGGKAGAGAGVRTGAKAGVGMGHMRRSAG